MLMGEYQHTLDTKQRLIIPAKFRDQLGSQFVVTRGLDGCLFGYPMSEWQLLEQKLKALPLTKRDARAFVRFLYSAATVCTLDKQGRINIPDPLVKYADLSKKCMVVGVSNRLEIWDSDRWDAYNADTADNFDEIAEDLNIDF
ncbi:division/cell wall cluster transcriptional repressor MraZ [Limosilactobacillus pontis]|uniref:Transcriptional regulator MraZ n=1 Tax=Limosilactobacillus pontis TaxID=35787 RepID=A0ABT7UZ24_9LACO|nr:MULTISPECIES: division/cell wall cluster transcriptional repressor MraZ [Limosilactobacillus]MDM8266946.1 division/cell wall cluster transcriptional repressor MraZ [Limosilactobacillus pontis]MDM8332094.1 division/cell wall cluster transcriptional repressor MraZ [Limosilactobacillus pontis]